MLIGLLAVTSSLLGVTILHHILSQLLDGLKGLFKWKDSDTCSEDMSTQQLLNKPGYPIYQGW